MILDPKRSFDQAFGGGVVGQKWVALLTSAGVGADGQWWLFASGKGFDGLTSRT